MLFCFTKTLVGGCPQTPSDTSARHQGGRPTWPVPGRLAAVRPEPREPRGRAGSLRRSEGLRPVPGSEHSGPFRRNASTQASESTPRVKAGQPYTAIARSKSALL